MGMMTRLLTSIQRIETSSKQGPGPAKRPEIRARSAVVAAAQSMVVAARPRRQEHGNRRALEVGQRQMNTILKIVDESGDGEIDFEELKEHFGKVVCVKN